MKLPEMQNLIEGFNIHFDGERLVFPNPIVFAKVFNLLAEQERNPEVPSLTWAQAFESNFYGYVSMNQAYEKACALYEEKTIKKGVPHPADKVLPSWMLRSVLSPEGEIQVGNDIFRIELSGVKRLDEKEKWVEFTHKDQQAEGAKSGNCCIWTKVTENEGLYNNGNGKVKGRIAAIPFALGKIVTTETIHLELVRGKWKRRKADWISCSGDLEFKRLCTDLFSSNFRTYYNSRYTANEVSDGGYLMGPIVTFVRNFDGAHGASGSNISVFTRMCP